MLVFMMVVAALALGLGLGYVATRAQCDREVSRAAGHALSARVAVGRALPLLDTLWEGLRITGEGKLLTPEQRENLDVSLDEVLHILRALTWGSGRYYRHERRGTHYEVLTYALHLQASDRTLLSDGAELVLYIDTRTGRLSCRHPAEFHDGRFTRVDRSEALDADDLAAQGHPGPSYVDQGREMRVTLGRIGGA